MNQAAYNEPNRAMNTAYNVFVTPTREAGACHAVVLNKDDCVAEYFDLQFWHHGEIRQASFVMDELSVLPSMADEGFCSVTYNEFLTLLYDALLQCYRYNPESLSDEYAKSKHICNAVNLAGKSQKTHRFRHLSSERQLINCYLNAIQNRDGSLIYDLYSQSLQEKSGSRNIFAHHWYHELEGFTILKTNILSNGKGCFTVNLLVTDASHKLLRVGILAEIIREDGRLCFDRVTVLDAEKADSHLSELIDSVMQVFVYQLTNKEAVRDYLDNQPEVIISGEFEQGRCYKWLRSVDVFNDGVDLFHHFRVQLILSDEQLIVYSDDLREVNMANLEMRSHISDFCRLSGRGVESMGQIYRKVIIEGKRLTPRAAGTASKGTVLAFERRAVNQ